MYVLSPSTVALWKMFCTNTTHSQQNTHKKHLLKNKASQVKNNDLWISRTAAHIVTNSVVNTNVIIRNDHIFAQCRVGRMTSLWCSHDCIFFISRSSQAYWPTTMMMMTATCCLLKLMIRYQFCMMLTFMSNCLIVSCRECARPSLHFLGPGIYCILLVIDIRLEVGRVWSHLKVMVVLTGKVPARCDYILKAQATSFWMTLIDTFAVSVHATIMLDLICKSH